MFFLGVFQEFSQEDASQEGLRKAFLRWAISEDSGCQDSIHSPTLTQWHWMVMVSGSVLSQGIWVKTSPLYVIRSHRHVESTTNRVSPIRQQFRTAICAWFADESCMNHMIEFNFKLERQLPEWLRLSYGGVRKYLRLNCCLRKTARASTRFD